MRFTKKMFSVGVLSFLLAGAGCVKPAPAPAPEPVEPVVANEETEASQGPVAEAVEATNEQQRVTEEQASAPSTPESEPEVQKPTAPVSEETRVTILARFSGFEPSTIRVKEGNRVVMQVLSMDGVHTYTLPGYNLNMMLGAGTPQTVEFVADKAGTFPFRCNFHGSMVGTLIVE